MLKHDYADVNGVRLHYAHAGSGKLILFVHGFPEFWYAWRRQLEEFGRDHLAVAPDTRGYNLSSKPEGVEQYRVKHLIADLRALARHLGHDRFVLVAHDWGAATAWAFAIAHPQSVEKLIVINGPHPAIFIRLLANDLPQQQASQYMRFFQTPDAAKKLSRDNFAMLEKFAFGIGLGRSPFSDDDLEAYRKAWSQPGALEAGLNYYRASRYVPPLPGGRMERAEIDATHFVVRVPTLVIWGERDKALLPGNLEGLEAFVPDLTVRRVPEASHWIVHERPAEVNGYIREFLAAG
jgi:pimeloyl-ACP methyl ester carboxylesterase